MKQRTIAFITVFAAIFLFGISMVFIGSMLPLLTEKFKLTEIGAGSLFSILPVGLLIGSITFGPISDRYGYRWVLFTACLFLAIGFLGIAHSNNLILLRIFVLFFGIGGGAINGASSALIVDLSDTGKIANLNLLGMFFGVGAFCMPLILSVINLKYYTHIIDLLSVTSLAVSIIFLLIHYPIGKKNEHVSLKLIAQFMNHKLFMALCFYLFFQSAFEALINNWMVSYFIEQVNVVRQYALLALSASVLGMTLMRVLTGGILRDLSHNRLMQVSYILLIMGFVCLILPVVFYVRLCGLLMIGAGLSPGFPVMLGLAGEIFKNVSGTAFSFAMLIALTGNVLINYLTGIVIQYYGMQAFIYVILVEIIIILLIYFIFIKPTSTSNTKK